MTEEPSPGGACKTGGTQIRAAVLKVQNQQAPEECCQEKQIGKPGESGAQGAQKAVGKTQTAPQDQAAEKLPGGLCRGDQPSRRLSQPPGVLGSS